MPKPRIFLEVEHDELARYVPVIVEMWDKKSYGRGKRQYLAEFTPEEREKLTEKYPTFYNWYLRKGFPDDVLMLPGTYALMIKAANFFGGL